MGCVAAMPSGPAPAGIIDQQVAHHLGGESEEMRPSSPPRAGSLRQLDVSLVHKAGCREYMSVPLGGEAPVSDRVQIFVGGIEDFVQSAAIAIVPALNEYSELISVGQGWEAYYHPHTGRRRTVIGSCLHPYSTTLLQRHKFPLPPGLNHSMSVQKMQCSTSRPTIASTTLGLMGDGSPSQEGLFQSVASRPYQP